MKLCLPKRVDIDGAVTAADFHTKKEWLHFLSVQRSLSNAHNRDAERKPFRTRDKADVSADNLPPPTSVVRVQIDDGSFGRDTFGNHLNLCRKDKMNDCCCISGT